MSAESNFQKSIKPMAVEELLDYYFYRRVAQYLVPPLIRFKIAPNTITTISLMFGLMAAYAVYLQMFWPGALLAVVAIFFDCCDGQVARLTGQASPLGRAMDGVFDAVWVSSLWVALHISGYFDSLSFNVFPWMVVAAASFMIHCWRFDATKISYMELMGKAEAEGHVDVGQAVDLLKSEFKKGHLLAVFICFFLVVQVFFFVRGTQKKQVYKTTPEQREQLKNDLEPILNLSSYLGEGHHNTLIIIGLLIAPWSPWGLLVAFGIIIVPMNLWWFICEFRWQIKFKAFKAQLASGNP